jgi:hypothetical protein
LANTANAINATLYEKLNFDFIRDSEPVGSIGFVPIVAAIRKWGTRHLNGDRIGRESAGLPRNETRGLKTIQTNRQVPKHTKAPRVPSAQFSRADGPPRTLTATTGLFYLSRR